MLQYLKQAASHGKDPPDHLQGLSGVRQEGQPAEGKSHQHSCGNSHQQEQPKGGGWHSQADTGVKVDNKEGDNCGQGGPAFW